MSIQAVRVNAPAFQPLIDNDKTRDLHQIGQCIIEMIKEDHPWVKLIASKENTGFSQGNNLAMRQVKNPFILLLNSDVYMEEDSLYKTLAYFRVNLNCDVLGARLNYASGKLQPSAGYSPDPINVVWWIMGLSLLPVIGNIIPPFHPKGKGFF